MTSPFTPLQSQKDELDRLKRDLKFANERADDASRNKSADTTSLISKYNRQLTELEDSLKSKQIQIDDLLKKLDDQKRDHEEALEDRDAELSVMQESLDSTLQNLNETKLVSTRLVGLGEEEGRVRLRDQSSLVRSLRVLLRSPQNTAEVDNTFTAQVDTLILDHRKELNQIIGKLSFHLRKSSKHEADDFVRSRSSRFQIPSSKPVSRRSTTPSTSSSPLPRPETPTPLPSTPSPSSKRRRTTRSSSPWSTTSSSAGRREDPTST